MLAMLAATLLPAGGAWADERSRPDDPLTGEWVAVVRAPDRGELAVRLSVARDGQRWEAFSRPGALRALVGTRRYLLGRLLGKVPAHGSALLLRNLALAQASGAGRLEGTLDSPVVGSFRVTGVVRGDSVDAVLRRGDASDSVGTLRMTRRVTDRPERDYGRLAADIRRAFTAHLYDPRLVETARWRDFFARLDQDFGEARDDLDALVSFYALKPALATSHIELTRDPVLADTPLDTLFARSAGAGSADSLVSLAFLTPRVAWLRVSRFRQVTAAVDRAFARIDSAAPRTLVIDVRGNQGGDVSSVAALSHLVRDSLFVGAFVGRRWIAAHGDGVPAPTDPSVPRFSRQDALTVLYTVRDSGAALGVVPPRAPFFGGAVYLLVDHRSGSATEPLAAAVKASGRGVLVGETTAGAMLTAPPHAVGQGFVLVLPEADFYTAAGARIEGRGVDPDVRVPSLDALGAVADRLVSSDPYSAAFVLGAARIEARRWDEARAAFEGVLAGSPDDARALYQVGRVAALSGRELERGEAALRRYLALPRDASLPSRSVALWRLGMILQARGRTADARAAYQAAVSADATNTAARDALLRLGSTP